MPPRKRHLATVSATTAALLEEEKLAQAMEAKKLRVEGYDWWEIADKMRITPQEARGRVAAGIKAVADLVSDATKIELLDLELTRLDVLMKANMPEALKGNINSGKFVLDLIKERVRLLELDKERVQSGQTTVVVGGTSVEYIAALQEIAAYAANAQQTVTGEIEQGTA